MVQNNHDPGKKGQMENLPPAIIAIIIIVITIVVILVIKGKLFSIFS